MGLFGSSEDTEAEQLAEQAKGGSVTAKRLETTEKGFGGGRDYFKDSQVLDWLEEGEQPHHLFPSTSSDSHLVAVENGENLEPNGKYRVVLMITDSQLLFLIGGDSGDHSKEIRYNEIESVQIDNDNEIIQLTTGDENFYFTVSMAFFGDDELSSAAEYIIGKSNINITDMNSNLLKEYKEAMMTADVDEFLDAPDYMLDAKLIPWLGSDARKEISWTDSDGDGDEAAAPELNLVKELGEENFKRLIKERGDDIDEEIITQFINHYGSDINEELRTTLESFKSEKEPEEQENGLGIAKRHLRDDESVEYVISGSRVETESHTKTESLTSTWNINNEKTKTVVTDERVLIVVPQRMSTEKRTITYDEITGVDIKTGRIQTKINIRTHNIVWDIWIDERKKAEEALEYIREKKQEAKQQPTQSDDSQEDPTEQLKKIKELHDEGILSDEEFEEKKEELIERI